MNKFALLFFLCALSLFTGCGDVPNSTGAIKENVKDTLPLPTGFPLVDGNAWVYERCYYDSITGKLDSMKLDTLYVFASEEEHIFNYDWSPEDGSYSPVKQVGDTLFAYGDDVWFIYHSPTQHITDNYENIDSVTTDLYEYEGKIEKVYIEHNTNYAYADSLCTVFGQSGRLFVTYWRGPVITRTTKLIKRLFNHYPPGITPRCVNTSATKHDETGLVVE